MGKRTEPTRETKQKPRLAVVSPFLDKSYGTERTVIEWLSHMPDVFETHVYSQRVEDLDPARFRWHRIPTLPGPGLLNFLWWFAANHVFRAWDRHVRGVRHDLVYSPGINCFGANVISVHIVFAEFLRQARAELRLARSPLRAWPRLLHRKIYYRLIVALERRIYANPSTMLVLYAKKTARDLERFYGRRDRLPVLYLGLDHTTFNPIRRAGLRDVARRDLGLAQGRFALLLVGNDLRKKGLVVLLDALTQLRDLPLDLLVAGREDPAPFQGMVHGMALDGHVRFLPPRKDVEFYYAAADAYVGPSLEDTFALPPAEAMACGLPVIVSAENGTCEIISHDVDGMVLDDPADSKTLAAMIRRLYEEPVFRTHLGEKAAVTARQYTWERNGDELAAIFEDVRRRKAQTSEQTLAQEM
ncbi:MAG TPA: glycosyltransferase family 4 protein [Candidatus Polarisedimenticolia bacterium]|nr:glycosyltransferase family 4 protein [Candidatus Polarisedimenticolia bacterium]